jgi:hypothetical protein
MGQACQLLLLLTVLLPLLTLLLQLFASFPFQDPKLCRLP